MAATTFVFNKAKADLLKGDIDLVNDDMRMLILGPSNDATSNKDAAALDDLTLDEPTDSNYARQSLSSQTVTQDDSNNRAEWDFADVTFGSNSGGDDYEALLVYKHVTDDTDSIPVAFFDNFSTTPGGADLNIVIGADGFLHLVD